MTHTREHAAAWVRRYVVAGVLAFIALDLVLPVFFSAGSAPSFTGACYMGFFFGQVGLHAALVVLMRGHLALRICSVVVLALLELWYMRTDLTTGNFTETLLVQWLLVAAVIVSLTTVGFRLQRLTSKPLCERVNHTSAQFSLMGLAVLVTAVCLVAGVFVRFDWSVRALFVAGFALAFAAVSIVLVPVLLVSRRTWTGVLLAAGLTGSASLLIPILDPVEGGVVVTLFAVPVAMNVGILLGLRSIGFRLCRVRPPERQWAKRPPQDEGGPLVAAIAPTGSRGRLDPENGVRPLDPKP